MAGRNGDDSGRWRELGIRLKQRRAILDPRWRNRRAFAEDNHLDYRLIYDIEEARRPNFGLTTLTALEVSYRLRPDSITAFLAGGEFDPVPGAAIPAHDESLASVVAALDPNQVPQEYRASVTDDYAWKTREERVAIAKERGLVHEAAIWADPDDKLTDGQRYLWVAYLRWRLAELATAQRGARPVGKRV
jgi:hypothetical protein